MLPLRFLFQNAQKLWDHDVEHLLDIFMNWGIRGHRWVPRFVRVKQLMELEERFWEGS